MSKNQQDVNAYVCFSFVFTWGRLQLKTPPGLLSLGGCLKNEASLPRFEIWYKKNRFIADFSYGQEKNL
jgi:hypothetical protein